MSEFLAGFFLTSNYKTGQIKSVYTPDQKEGKR